MSGHIQDLDEAPEVPRMFHQLGILVLDGSGSMNDLTVHKIRKAEAVNNAVNELIGHLKHHSRMAKNFSIAVVTFDTSANAHTPVTPVIQADNFGDYNPMQGHGGGTDIGVGLRCAQGIAQQFLSQANTESVPRSVVAIVMSDGMSSGDPLAVANELKQDPKITICTTLFAAVGQDASQAQQLLRDMATSHNHYRTTYGGEDLRQFFVKSISSGKNVKIA